jgi:small subunit ribosomal protein S2
MKPYIYCAKSGIYIIDLRQTLQSLKKAYEYIVNISANGGKVLFVGTKYQARDIVEEQAIRSNNFYVNFRWLGGMLTNFNTIKQSIVKLKKLEEMAGPDRDYVGILKKEAVRMERERKKLENVLGGISELRKKPAAVFIVDIKREFIAVNEAKKLGIPIIAIVDTNCDPRGIDYMIPGNDDSAHCIQLFTSIIASASMEGRKMYDSKIVEMKRQPDAEDENNGRKKAKAAVEDEMEIDESEAEVEEVEEVKEEPEEEASEDTDAEA